EIVSDEKKLDRTVRKAKGNSLKALIGYQTTEGEVIYVKTGISGVSAEGAMKNLEAEIPDWDFNRVRQAAHAAWRKQLSRITIETSNQRQREIFYTSLYHMIVISILYYDVDGQYRVFAGNVHPL